MIPRKAVHAALLAAFFWVASAGAAAAQTTLGTLTGRVTDAAGGLPIVSANLIIVGTTAGTQTNGDGQYTIRGLAAGAVTVRLLRVGYAEKRVPVTIVAGRSTTLNIELTSIPITLSPMVTTATGEQRRIEVGNSIAQVSAAQVTETHAVTNVGDLLTSRAAGVLVIAGTQTGAGVRIRVRGTSSLSLSNNPIYVIDGIRVEGSTGSSTLSVGGTTPSRVGDLNPEEIENIEIVRGPSAATLYGTDAANGVIVITTKRGVAGKPQWTYYTEQTAITDRNDYPTAYRAWRTGTSSTTNSTQSNTVQCLLTQQASGACVADSTTSYDLTADKQSTPFGRGYRTQHGLQVKGGTEAIRYFLHGEWEYEDGVTKVPEFENQYMAAHGLALLDEMKNPNKLGRVSTRMNLNLALSPKADLALSAGYTSQYLYLPMSDDAGTAGIAANIYGGPGSRYNLNPAGDTLWGWRQFTPRDIYQAVSKQAVQRMISSVAGNWRPTSWLVGRANFGLDFTDRTDTQICRFQNCPDLGTDRLGYKRDNRSNFYVYTLDGGVTATKSLSAALDTKTTVGVQFYRNLFDRNGATGLVLPPGATTVTAGATAAADESTSESRTLGAYIEEGIAFRDRLFVTGAVRSDRNSAFGADFKTVFYPKLAVSWVASDEAFFPKASWLNQLRLRTAYGASGVQPGTIDAVQYYTATSGRNESGDVPAVVYSTLGNRNLKPERSTELELGLDGTFWDSRITAEFTYYSKISKDALINRVLPPSLGTGATSRLENLGEVHNNGFEGLVTAQLLKRPRFSWDVTLNGSFNDNKVQSLGGQPTIGTTQQNRAGYPILGWWSRVLTGYNDANKNGIIELSEITVSDTAVFIGYSVPRTEMAMTHGFDFLDGLLRLTALIDYKGGHKIYNNTERIRCLSRLNCNGLINPNASLAEQARVVMGREHASRSVAGYFEDGDFIRFRELALTATAPGSWARRLHSRAVTATASVRNVGILWTKYTGVDPEAFGTTGDAPSEFQAFAPPTYFSLRINFGF